MAKIRFIDCEGVQIPLSIPIEMDLPKFIGDDKLDPKTRQYLMLFSIIQEQLKILKENENE